MENKINVSTKFNCRYRENLKRFLPNIFQLLTPEPDWEKIDIQINIDHQKRINIWDEEHKDGIEIRPQFLHIYEYPLYYVFHFALNRRPDALTLLDYFNILFGEVFKSINKDSIHLITPILTNFLKTINGDYIHYIGELAVLDSLLKTKKYNLIGVEKVIEKCKSLEHSGSITKKGKSIDFCVTDIEDGKNYLVEVKNVHIDDDNPDVVKLRRKLNKKVLAKSKNQEDGIEFVVIPVLWVTRHVTLVAIENQIKRWANFHVEGTFEPFAFFTFVDEVGGTEFRFRRISNLFENVKLN